MPPIPINKPKLTNRGPAGLLKKLTKEDKERLITEKVDTPQLTRVLAKHRIAPSLQSLEVPIGELIPDPNNARLHPERNLEAIKASLELYGQVKPIVVRKATNVVVAGNGTLEAALALGWSTIAASYVEMSETEATGYGLADNRTAELARWDLEVFARLDKLLQTVGHETIGWTQDELDVLRAADWTPPVVDDTPFSDNGEKGKGDPLIISFTPDQYESVKQAIEVLQQLKGGENGEGLDQAQCLELICQQWLEYWLKEGDANAEDS